MRILDYVWVLVWFWLGSGDSEIYAIFWFLALWSFVGSYGVD